MVVELIQLFFSRGAPIAFRVDPENKESQEFAESASFLKTRNTFSGYDYKQPIGPNRIKFDKVKTVERTRDDKAFEEFEFPTTPNPTTTPSTPVNRGTMVYAMTSTTTATYDDGKYTTQAPIDNRTNGKYSTARRLETSRTTPFYTPTIPTIASRFDQTATTTTPPVVYTQPTTTTSRVTTTTTTTAAPDSSTTPLSLEKNPINVSEHAIEMMKTLQELEMVTATSATPDSELGSRLGLNIPPSSGPDALNALAVYFANAMENATKTVEQQGSQSSNTTSPPSDAVTSSGSDNEKIKKANFRDETVEGYEKLFQ